MNKDSGISAISIEEEVRNLCAFSSWRVVDCIDKRELFNEIIGAFFLFDEKKRLKLIDFMTSSYYFFKEIIIPLFWLVHTWIYHPEDKDCYSKDVSRIWKSFCLDLDKNMGVDPFIRDTFYHFFPYFSTQAIHHIYSKLFGNCQIIHEMSFRMNICYVNVKFFTAIEPAYQHLLDRYSRYFRFSLQTPLSRKSRPKSCEKSFKKPFYTQSKIVKDCFNRPNLCDRVSKMRKELSISDIQVSFPTTSIEKMKQSSLSGKKAAALRLVDQFISLYTL